MADDTTQAGADDGGGHDDFDIDVTPQPVEQGTEQAAPAEEPKAQAQADEIPPELARELRREGLKPVPGENATAAYARLAHHNSRKAASYGRELGETRREAQALRQMMEPIVREHWENRRRAAVEEAAQQIPDKVTQPEEYQIWLQEQILLRDEERTESQRLAAEHAEQAQRDQDIQGQLVAIDNAGYSKVAEGLGLVQGVEPDPVFSSAYDVFTESAIAGARSFFPTASDAEIEQFVALSQRLDIRRAELSGLDFRDVMKERLEGVIRGLERAGMVQRVSGNGAAGATATNGSANGQQVKRTTGTPAGAAKSTAERLKADTQAAAKRGPSAVAAATRANAATGTLPDVGELDFDEYFELVMSGALGSEEQRAAPHRKQR